MSPLEWLLLPQLLFLQNRDNYFWFISHFLHPLFDRKSISCKMLKDSSKLGKSHKILTKNSILSRFLDAMTFFQDSCNKLCSFTKRKNLRNLVRNKFSVYRLRSIKLCISPKSKHNQPLEVKFDELYTCWTNMFKSIKDKEFSGVRLFVMD